MPTNSLFRALCEAEPQINYLFATFVRYHYHIDEQAIVKSGLGIVTNKKSTRLHNSFISVMQSANQLSDQIRNSDQVNSGDLQQLETLIEEMTQIGDTYITAEHEHIGACCSTLRDFVSELKSRA